MNQRQSRGRGDAPRQAPAPARQDNRPPTENEQITRDQRAQGRMQSLFELIRQRRPEIEAVLPPDVPYLKFEAVVNMAIRREPRLLDCYAPSFIKACIQSAYDGLLPDGNQAVILYSKNKVPGTGEDGVKAQYRLEARYQSMVYGLRLKLVQSGAATFCDAIVVYKGEEFQYSRGLDTVLVHEPTIDDAKRRREDAVAAYAIATLPDGTKVFDVLTRGDVMAAREVAKTKNVWDGPFWAEMWKKTAIRRLSKAVPTARPIRDAEALEMYPQFGGALPAAARALPPPRPDRRDFGALEQHQELPLDLGAFEGGYNTEESRRATVEEPGEKKGDSQSGEGKKASETRSKEAKNTEGANAREGGQVVSSETSGSESDGSANAETGAGAGPDPEGEGEAAVSSSPDLPLPETPEAWDEWANILIGGLEKLPDTQAIDAEHDRNRRLIDAAPDDVRKRVIAAMTERMTDLVADEAQPSLAIEGE